MNEISNLLFYGETIGCVLFCVLFGLRSRWWKTQMGPNMMAMMAVLAVFQMLGVISRLPELRDWFMLHATVIRFWSFLALFIVVWWRVIILIMIQHQDAMDAREARRKMDDTDPELKRVNK